MKIAGLVFIVFILMVVLKWRKIYNISIPIMIIVFCLGFAILYIQVHNKNKERNTPRPVYITNNK